MLKYSCHVKISEWSHRVCIVVLFHFWKCISKRLFLDNHHAGLDEEVVQVRGGHLAVQEKDKVQQLRWVSWRGRGQRKIKDRCEVNVTKYSPKITPLTSQKGSNNFIEIETWWQVSHREYKIKRWEMVIHEFFLSLKINVVDGNT